MTVHDTVQHDTVPLNPSLHTTLCFLQDYAPRVYTTVDSITEEHCTILEHYIFKSAAMHKSVTHIPDSTNIDELMNDVYVILHEIENTIAYAVFGFNTPKHAMQHVYVRELWNAFDLTDLINLKLSDYVTQEIMDIVNGEYDVSLQFSMQYEQFLVQCFMQYVHVEIRDAIGLDHVRDTPMEWLHAAIDDTVKEKLAKVSHSVIEHANSIDDNPFSEDTDGLLQYIVQQ